MELATSTVTLDGRLNTSKTKLVYVHFPSGFITHVSKEMSLRERQQSVNVYQPDK